jgi:hypothetical protein
MMERIAEASPRFKARMAAVSYVLTALAGFDLFFVLGGLVVRGDAAATANNILAHEQLFRLGFAAELIGISGYIAVTALFYGLFKPVNRSLSLLAAFFSLMGCATQAIISLLHLAPLALLGGAQYLSVFTLGQLQALALLSLKLYGQGFNIGLIFFGFYCVLIGYLIFRSTFLPRILGLGMALAGLPYLAFLYPPLANSLPSYVLVLPGLGEGSLVLWLFVMGVNDERWQEQASTAREGRP